MRLRKIFLTAAALAFSAGLVSTLKSSPAAERFDHKVRNDFFAGFGGNAEALARGMKICEEILAENPKHAEALVWHGGGLYFAAGQAFRAGDREKGAGLFQRGIKEMDEAVSIAPDQIGVRIPRGAVLLTSTRQMPDTPIRVELIRKGLTDYAHVYEMQKGHLDKLGEHPRGELLFGLAEGYSRAGEMEKAQAFFEKIAAEMAGTPYAKRSANWLRDKTLAASDTGCIGCHVSK